MDATALAAKVEAHVILGLDIIKYIISTSDECAQQFAKLLYNACQEMATGSEDSSAFMDSIFFPILFAVKTHNVYFEKKFIEQVTLDKDEKAEED